MEINIGININDDYQPFTDLILDGSKTIETRNTPTLRPYVGKKVGIISTSKKRKAKLVGYIDIIDEIKYTNEEQFNSDYNKHLVGKDSPFYIKDVKYGYVLSNPERIEPRDINSKGIISRSLTKETMKISKRQLQDEEVTAYHGTPHSFDKFSTQYMGTGEGKQAFGWGLYFTDLEDISKYYAEKLGDDSTKILGKINDLFFQTFGLEINHQLGYARLVHETIDEIKSGDIGIMRGMSRLKNASIKMRQFDDTKIGQFFNKVLDLERQKKYIYKVTLHKGKTPNQYTWLEWDKPVPETQLAKIIPVLISEIKGKTWWHSKYLVGNETNSEKEKIISEVGNELIKDIENLAKKKVNGGDLYELIQRRIPREKGSIKNDKEASLFLLNNGIDGIKYPADSLSRGATSYNTSGFNYVVFDENAVSIEKQTQFEAMEISKKELRNQKVINYAHDYITRRRGPEYAPDFRELQKWIDDNPEKVKQITKGELKEDAEDVNFMGEITKGELEEAKKARTKLRKKKKGDRCTRIAKSKYDVWPSAYACVPESTSKALTRDGWKTVDELNIGEEILTYNINTDKLEFKPILNLHRYKDAKTNVVRSGNNGFVFEATDNHKWVVKLDETKGKRVEKYERIKDKAFIETKDLILNKHNKHLVVTAPYDGGEKIKKDKIYKYGDNWVKYILDISDEQRQTWLFSAIVYDGHQKKIERLTENKEQINELDWIYTGPYNKQSFDFKQKDVEHRDAFLLSAFLNNGMVTWKKHNTKNIYSCYYTSNKRFKNTSNFKLVKENNTDVWCPETENGTWVMMQETEGSGIITTTGNSGAVVKCRQGKIWKDLKEAEDETLDEKWSQKYKKSIDCNNPKGFSQKAHCKGRLKEEEENFGSDDINLSGHKNYTDWVIIHRNLNKPPYWSIKESNGSKKIGKVIGYDTSILLKDVRFIVLKGGQERARIEQTKNVHGGAVGKIVDSGGNYNTNGWTLVTYRPFIDDTFIEVETGEPIYNAKEAVLKNEREIWVKKEDSLNEKTDFSKEKKQGLHGWFARQGGKGKSKGWVDCNTCRDGKCKSCGRKEGESRSKYPACRPTPSACKTKGKGKSWGKKSTNEEFPIQSLYREKENMEIKKKDIFDEDLVLKRDQSKKAIYVQSDLDSDKAKSQETFKNKEALKSAGFKWDGDIKSWKTDDVNFMLAKKTIETINKKEFLIDTLEQLEEIIASSENTPEKEGLMGKIDMYINDLSNATDEAAMSAEIRRYLTFFSKFKGHSLFNTWLIYIQSGGKATKVAGFRQWEAKFYRRVKKGAKGLQIFVPIFTKSTSKDDETGEEITKQNVTRFKPGYVFDIRDTEAIDERGEVPETPNWFADLEPTERSIELYKYFIELCEDMGIQISKSGSERGEKGYSAGNKINISSAKEGAGEVSTLVHEIAHELMHWKKSSIYYQENTNAELRELQAESVSYVVLKHYELPTEHHPTYLALWKANKEKIKDNVKVITDVAKFIITEIDKIEKRNQKNEVINEQTKQDIKNELKLNEIKNLFKRLLK